MKEEIAVSIGTSYDEKLDIDIRLKQLLSPVDYETVGTAINTLKETISPYINQVKEKE